MAVATMTEGARVRRRGWNGKRQWIAYMPPMLVPAKSVNERTRRLLPSSDVVVCGYFTMFTERGELQPGWLASQADMLADDWEVCNE